MCHERTKTRTRKCFISYTQPIQTISEIDITRYKAYVIEESFAWLSVLLSRIIATLMDNSFSRRLFV